MEKVDGVTAEIARIFAAKEERRKALARLPFTAKVEAVIKLQEMAAPILRARGKVAQPWTISATSEKSPSVSTPTNPGRIVSRERK